MRPLPIRACAALLAVVVVAPAAPRRLAVRRGLVYLVGRLRDDTRAASLDTDAVAIFLQLGETATDPWVRRRALAEAARQARRLEAVYAAPGGLRSTDAVQGALWLLTEAPALGLPAGRLRAALLERLADQPETAYFGREVGRLEALSEDWLFYLLLAAYTVERARLVEPALPPPRLRLADLLAFALSRRYADYAGGEPVAVAHFFLATHVAYVLSDYGRLRLRPEDLGPLLPWLRIQLGHFLQEGYVDGVAEAVEVLRLLGAEDDPQVAAGIRFLLRAQRPDGSWRAEVTATCYDRVHPTWVAVHALKEREFRNDSSWRRYVEGLLAELRAKGALPAPGTALEPPGRS